MENKFNIIDNIEILKRPGSEARPEYAIKVKFNPEAVEIATIRTPVIPNNKLLAKEIADALKAMSEFICMSVLDAAKDKLDIKEKLIIETP